MSNNRGTAQTQNKGMNIQSFLETLRNSQSRPLTDNRPNLPPFAEYSAQKEIEQQRVAEFNRQRSQEWNRVFSAKQTAEKQEIEKLRQRLRQLASHTQNKNPEIAKAIETPIAQAGEYHRSFLERLEITIRTLNLNANQGSSWLSIYHRRTKDQGTYWRMAKSKGTSYTQNSERTVAIVG